jgi:cell division protein FtsL
MRKWFSEINISLRTSAVLASVGFAMLLVLMLIWLSMSTRTAVLNAEIDKSDARRIELEDEVNARWRELGELSAPDKMTERARALGFEVVPVEYLVIETQPLTETAAVSATELLNR